LKNTWSDGNKTHDSLEQMMMMIIYFNNATDTTVPFTHILPNTEAEKSFPADRC
jgi:hypothetical protein